MMQHRNVVYPNEVSKIYHEYNFTLWKIDCESLSQTRLDVVRRKGFDIRSVSK